MRPKQISVADYIQIVVLTVIFLGLMLSWYVQKQKERLEETEAFLRSSVDLINKAYDVLKCDTYGVTNDLVSWVTAARLLTRAQMLAAKISLQSHQTIFESEHDF